MTCNDHLLLQGGCGACTVMLSHYDGTQVVHRAVNACLCPLYAIEGMHVVTVEGKQPSTCMHIMRMLCLRTAPHCGGMRLRVPPTTLS